MKSFFGKKKGKNNNNDSDGDSLSVSSTGSVNSSKSSFSARTSKIRSSISARSRTSSNASAEMKRGPNSKTKRKSLVEAPAAVPAVAMVDDGPPVPDAVEDISEDSDFECNGGVDVAMEILKEYKADCFDQDYPPSSTSFCSTTHSEVISKKPDKVIRNSSSKSHNSITQTQAPYKTSAVPSPPSKSSGSQRSSFSYIKNMDANISSNDNNMAMNLNSAINDHKAIRNSSFKSQNSQTNSSFKSHNSQTQVSYKSNSSPSQGGSERSSFSFAKNVNGDHNSDPPYNKTSQVSSENAIADDSLYDELEHAKLHVQLLELQKNSSSNALGGDIDVPSTAAAAGGEDDDICISIMDDDEFIMHQQLEILEGIQIAQVLKESSKSASQDIEYSNFNVQENLIDTFYSGGAPLVPPGQQPDDPLKLERQEREKKLKNRKQQQQQQQHQQSGSSKILPRNKSSKSITSNEKILPRHKSNQSINSSDSQKHKPKQQTPQSPSTTSDSEYINYDMAKDQEVESFHPKPPPPDNSPPHPQLHSSASFTRQHTPHDVHGSSVNRSSSLSIASTKNDITENAPEIPARTYDGRDIANTRMSFKMVQPPLQQLQQQYSNKNNNNNNNNNNNINVINNNGNNSNNNNMRNNENNYSDNNYSDNNCSDNNYTENGYSDNGYNNNDNNGYNNDNNGYNNDNNGYNNDNNGYNKDNNGYNDSGHCYIDNSFHGNNYNGGYINNSAYNYSANSNNNNNNNNNYNNTNTNNNINNNNNNNVNNNPHQMQQPFFTSYPNVLPSFVPMNTHSYGRPISDSMKAPTRTVPPLPP